MGRARSIVRRVAVETSMTSSRKSDGIAAASVSARGVSAAAAALLLAGCVAGPDFKRPAPPDIAGVTAQPPPATVATAGVPGGGAQRFVACADIAGEWWTLFHSKPPNALIDQALTNSPDLKAAQAALRAAHEGVLAQRGAYFPSVREGVSASRQRQPGVLAPVPNNNAFEYSLITTQVSVSYAPDVFGLNRRTVETLRAQEQAVRYQELATYTALTANVAVTAIQVSSVEQQGRPTPPPIPPRTRPPGSRPHPQAK